MCGGGGGALDMVPTAQGKQGKLPTSSRQGKHRECRHFAKSQRHKDFFMLTNIAIFV